MRKLSFILLTVSMTAVSSAPAAPPASAEALYEAKTYRNAAGETLPYRLMRPAGVDRGKTYPLVLFLHGAGERGVDNQKQLIHGAGVFATPENRRKYPCFVVAPQCPAEARWVEVDWSQPAYTPPEKPSPTLRLVGELVDKLVAELPVDKGRVYATGLSMGGYGTWELIVSRPQRFTAAMPLCGGGDPGRAVNLKDLPLWAFHGAADTVVPTCRTTTMIDAIRHAGGQPRITIYPGTGHDCWTRTYADPAVLAWFFAQRK